MLISMAPLYLLFELSLLLARWFGQTPARRETTPDDEDSTLPARMIFDLKSGKRRRVVQVVFGVLAFIFFISFVGFGIGSGSAGGIFDALGIGGSLQQLRPAVRTADLRRRRTRSRPTRQTATPTPT